jgi:hypothetical protein
MLNKLWNLTWYAHIAACLLDPRFSIQYIGRYTKRAVMAEYRTPPRRGDGKIVRFSYKDYAHGAKTSYMTFVGCFFGNWTELQQLFIKAGKDSTIAAALLRPG